MSIRKDYIPYDTAYWQAMYSAANDDTDGMADIIADERMAADGIAKDPSGFEIGQIIYLDKQKTRPGVVIRHARNSDHPYPTKRILVEWIEDLHTWHGYFSAKELSK